MHVRTYTASSVLAVIALSIACGRQSPSPVSPTSSSIASTDAASAADGSTLKVTAPDPVSPVGNIETEGTTVTMVVKAAAGKNGPIALAYDFELYNAANTKIRTQIISGTSWTVDGIDYAASYTWRARATADGAYGPWSATASFRTPDNQGYVRGNEIYDPLINGKTVGTPVGPTHFIPGVGISLDSLESYVYYVLPTPLVEGEFSYLATNVRTRHEGGKTKVMAMSSGFDDITTNDRRMTFEKRNDGSVAWRLLTHDDQIDTTSAERGFVQFNLTDTFFFQMSWRNNVFDPLIKQGGANGRLIYDLPKHWNGRPYDADPHVVYLGGPGGRAGADSGSVPNIIIRQVWVSPRSRPANIAQ